MTGSLKRALPWVVSLGIVGYLFSTVDLGAVGRALAGADLGVLAVWIVVFSLLVFLADGACLRLLFGRLIGGVTLRESLSIKAVSYFLNAITYTAGAGGIAYFLHKKRGVGFLHALSMLLWLNFVDVIALLILLTLGCSLGPSVLPGDIGAQLLWVLGAGWIVIAGALVYWRLGFDFMVLGRLRSWRIFEAFGQADLGDYGALVAARTVFIGLYVVMAWVLLPTFHLSIGVGALLVYVPLLTFVQIIPASISGLGAVQAVMIALYAPHAAAGTEDPAALVLAFSTVVGPGTTLVRLGLGYAFMGDISKDLVADEQAIEALRKAEEQDQPSVASSSSSPVSSSSSPGSSSSSASGGP